MQYSLESGCFVMNIAPLRLFEWNHVNRSKDGSLFVRMKMDYALIGAASEMKLGITKILDERTVDNRINIRQDLTHAAVGEYLFICESGVAPYILSRLLLDTSGKFCESLDLIQWIASGECDIGEFIRLHYFQNIIDRHFTPTGKIP